MTIDFNKNKAPKTYKCVNCGKNVQKLSSTGICMNCVVDSEKASKQDLYARVRDFMYDNPNKNISEISKALKVPVIKIRQVLNR